MFWKIVLVSIVGCRFCCHAMNLNQEDDNDTILSIIRSSVGVTISVDSLIEDVNVVLKSPQRNMFLEKLSSLYVVGSYEEISKDTEYYIRKVLFAIENSKKQSMLDQK